MSDLPKAPQGHIIDEDGVVRKVLGTLPMTADGCVIGQNSDLWYVLPAGAATETVCMTHTPYMEAHQPAYSSREAAEAANKINK